MTCCVRLLATATYPSDVNVDEQGSLGLSPRRCSGPTMSASCSTRSGCGDRVRCRCGASSSGWWTTCSPWFPQDVVSRCSSGCPVERAAAGRRIRGLSVALTYLPHVSASPSLNVGGRAVFSHQRPWQRSAYSRHCALSECSSGHCPSAGSGSSAERRPRLPRSLTASADPDGPAVHSWWHVIRSQVEGAHCRSEGREDDDGVRSEQQFQDLREAVLGAEGLARNRCKRRGVQRLIIVTE